MCEYFCESWSHYVMITAVMVTNIQVLLVDPGTFREVDESVRGETKGAGSVEVVSVREIKEGDELFT